MPVSLNLGPQGRVYLTGQMREGTRATVQGRLAPPCTGDACLASGRTISKAMQVTAFVEPCTLDKARDTSHQKHEGRTGSCRPWMSARIPLLLQLFNVAATQLEAV